MNRLLALLTALLIAACSTAARDKATVYTEEGVRAAEAQWDQHYHDTLQACADKHEAGSPGAKNCFGATFDADDYVEDAVRAVVAALRAYWVARAAGDSPDWRGTANEVAKILGDLPPDVRQYFERVKGL